MFSLPTGESIHMPSLHFAQFREQLEANQISERTLARVLEMDPESTRPRVRFRVGALADEPPADYDVDRALYDWQQREQLNARMALRGAKAKRPLLVAEGDSWFNLPPIIRPTAIADRIDHNGVFTVANIAYWGDTLQGMLRSKQYLRELAIRPAAWFALSAGGNDMQDALAAGKLLLPASQAPAGGPWLSTEGSRTLTKIGAGYKVLLSEVQRDFPGQKVLCYCYDYPKPATGSGKYIGRHLKALGYPRSQWTPIVQSLMDEMAAVIRTAIAPFRNVVFLECFGIAQASPWFDDMHPESKGFRALAKAFETRMLATSIRAPKKRQAKQTTRKKPKR